MNKKIIYYSIDEKINIGELKNKKNIKIDAEKENMFLKYCKKNNIKAIFGKDINLKKTKQIPYILYYIGNISIIKDKKIIGIVGPRLITPFIEKQLEIFFKKIKKINTNIAIISGLADGTDFLAHKLSIKYNIPTISVLGFGIAKGLNSNSRHIINEIIENNGLILSEFKLKQAGTNRTFPQRNRIISGLSDILFVAQSKENSGTFITIENCIDLNIPVYTCFSSIDDENGYGTNKYIKNSKCIGVYDIDHFIDKIKFKFGIKNILENKNRNIKFNNNNEKEIFNSLNKGVNTIDLLISNLNIDSDIILNSISNMELDGIIEEKNGEYNIL